NGDIAAASLAALRPDARVIAWRDVLHDGPVPDCEPAVLRRLRAAHPAAAFAGPGRDVLGELEERDATIAGAAAFERVELWFEHDFADQLQLLQALDALAEVAAAPPV